MANQTLSVIVNRTGGAAARAGDSLGPVLCEIFAREGAGIDLHIVGPDEFDRALGKARGSRVVIGGGDGTLNRAARYLAGTGRQMAVLPLGTLNHFAQAIGLDGTLEQAAHVAVHGRIRAVDLGRANGRPFLNNASIGAYARMVLRRDAMGLPKWLATIPASLAVLLRPGARHLHIEIDGKDHRLKTPLLFFGNNRYSLEAGRVGQREGLDAGVLSVFALANRSVFGLIVAALRILGGKARPETDFAALAECREVKAWRRGLHYVALDGEVQRLHFPLRISIEPGGLEVMVPA